MKVLKWLDEHFEEALLVVLLVLISCVQLVQVIFRNLSFIPSLTWAEEFCRFCWIWSVFLSLPYTIRKGNMLRVALLLDLFPKILRGVFKVAVELVVTASMILMGVHSVTVVRNILTSGETSPAMLWPMWIIYSVLLVGFFLGALRGMQQVILHIKHFGQDELSTVQQTMAEAEEEANAGRNAEGGRA